MDRVLAFTLIYVVEKITVNTCYPWIVFLGVNNTTVFKFLYAAAVIVSCFVAFFDSPDFVFSAETTIALSILAPFCHSKIHDVNKVATKE